MGKFVDLTRHKFGRLTALSPFKPNINGEITWLCECSCGTRLPVIGRSLRSGHTRSCGCLKRELATKHGMEGTPEYVAFQGARARCTNQKDKRYPQYGGRGIRFKFTSFEQFIADVGKRPSPKHSLDRKENDGNYEPGNCRWATKTEQVKNQRKRKAIQNFSTAVLLQELFRRGISV